MTTNYLTTCFKSSNIISTTKANLRLSTDKAPSPFLVIAKPNSLEFFLIKSNGELESKFEYQLFANILYVTSIPSYSTELPDHIFVLTMDFQFSITTVNDVSVSIDCYGDVLYKEMDPAESFLYLQDHVICSNNCIKGYIALFLYKYTLLVIPWRMNENRVLNINKVCKIRLNVDFEVLSLVEMGSTSNILSAKNEYFIGGLFQSEDNSQPLPATFFKIHKIEDIDGEIREPGMDEGWTLKFPENIYKVIFMKGDRFSRGLLAFGLHNIYFYLYETKTKYEKKTVELSIGEYAHVPNHDNLLLVSDKKSGCLFLLVIDLNEVSSPIEIKYLGRTSICSTLQYLEKKMVFLGSIEDNSYLLKILDTGKLEDREMPYLSIVSSYENLGNITGIDLINMESNHTKQLILTSPFKRETLNIFQKGVTMHFSFVLNFTGVIETVFFLKSKKLVLCGTDSNCLFFNQNNDFELTFLKTENFTITHAFEFQGKIVIISKSKILIVNENLLVSADVDLEAPAIFASNNNNCLCLLLQEASQFILAVFSLDLVLISKRSVPTPVSAFYIDDNFIYIGYWLQDRISYFPINCIEKQQDLELAGSQLSFEQHNLIKNVVVCSIQIWLGKYLLLGLNNGNLIVKECEFSADKQLISVAQTKVTLFGDRNLQIYATKSHGLLINCDELFVVNIGSDHEMLTVEKILIRLETQPSLLCELENLMQNEEASPPMLLVSSESVNIGYLEHLTKYMVSPFGEDSILGKSQRKQERKPNQSDRASQLSKEWVAVGSDICITGDNCVSFDEDIVSEVTVYSLETEEILDKYSAFDTKEQINNLLYDETQNLLLLTTDSLHYTEEFIPEFSNEPIGRIYLFYVTRNNDYATLSYNQKLLNFLVKLEFRNPIESIKKMRQNLYVFYCGSMLYIYELIKKDKLLQKFDFLEVYKKDLKLQAFQLDVYEEFLIICDPFKNLSLYHYNPEEHKLLFVAKIFLGGTISYSSFYAKEKILCFDDNGNLVISQRKKKAETDLEKISLQILSGINFGEKITNSLKINDIPCPEYQKILKKADSKPESFMINEVIWTSNRGSIGILAEIPRDLYSLFMDLQESILLEMKGRGVFGFEYEKWRQMKDFLGNRIQNNFVDGDIVKQIKNFSPEMLEKVLNRMSLLNKPKLNEFVFLLEDLEKKLFS